MLALGSTAPFMIQLVASFQTDANLYFVMELVTGGGEKVLGIESISSNLALRLARHDVPRHEEWRLL